jgi:hypothetical protein
MDLTGFLNDLADFSNTIDIGRKGLATDGEEHEGRLNYEEGISGAFASFQKAHTSAEPEVIVLAELIFLQQELRFCHEADAITRSSLTQAIQSFEDALRCLKIVENKSAYRSSEATYPTAPKYRIQGFPKDAFHLACISHRTRLQNVLRAPGINMTEKAVLQQRIENMSAAQGSYTQKQRNALCG